MLACERRLKEREREGKGKEGELEIMSEENIKVERCGTETVREIESLVNEYLEEE